MDSVAKGIESKEIPLSSENHSVAWNYDNQYRNLDAANKEAPAPLTTPTQAELDVMTDA